MNGSEASVDLGSSRPRRPPSAALIGVCPTSVLASSENLHNAAVSLLTLGVERAGDLVQLLAKDDLGIVIEQHVAVRFRVGTREVYVCLKLCYLRPRKIAKLGINVADLSQPSPHTSKTSRLPFQLYTGPKGNLELSHEFESQTLWKRRTYAALPRWCHILLVTVRVSRVAE